MTLEEIIEEIKEKYPYADTFSNESIVRKIDNLQKRIFRKFKIITAQDYEIIEGTPSYPVAIHESSVVDTLVDGISYPFIQVGSRSANNSRYTTMFQGFMHIYPTPEQDGTLTVYYYGPAESLSASNLSESPELDENFHLLLVYGVCKEIAETGGDGMQSNIVNGFAQQYNALEKELAAAYVKQEVMIIQSESGW